MGRSGEDRDWMRRGSRERGSREYVREWDREKYRRSDRRREPIGEDRHINSDLLRTHRSLKGNPEGPACSDDEDLRVAELSEFRRLKRQALSSKERYSLWRLSPTPEPDTAEYRRIEEENQRDLETLLLGEDAQKYGRKSGEDDEDDEASVCSADVQEAALLSDFLTAYRDELAREEEERRRREEEEREVGPAPPVAGTDDGLQYGGASSYGSRLRPGEGQAMAKFVQAGARIPRRGEIGLTADTIAKFESAGYVMSGNRHKRMEAIRIKKENQVYTAEERAALALINYEEKKAKEDKVITEMRRLVEQTLEGKDGTAASQKFNA